MARVKRMATLAEALDAQSLQWMNDNIPGLVDALEAEIENGETPETIRRFVMAHTMRFELALRCEQAARAIQNGGD